MRIGCGFQRERQDVHDEEQNRKPAADFQDVAAHRIADGVGAVSPGVGAVQRSEKCGRNEDGEHPVNPSQRRETEGRKDEPRREQGLIEVRQLGMQVLSRNASSAGDE